MKNNGNRGDFKIPKIASKFASKKWKKYWKENKDAFDSKKDGLKEFCTYLQDMMPDVVEFLVKYGHLNNEEIRTVKNDIFTKFVNEDFVKYLAKRVKKDEDFAKDMKLFPILVREIGMAADEENKKALAANPNATVYDMTDLYKISKMIMKKGMKKMVEDNVPEDMAFDLLSIIPTPKAMQYSPVYRIRSIFGSMYEWAKTTTVPVHKIIENLVKEDQYSNIIVFALLERRDFYSNLTDSQKNLFNDITTWCLNQMETMNGDEIGQIVSAYTKSRMRDDQNGKDNARRFNLSVLSENDYPNITKVIKRMVTDHPEIEKYL